MIEQSEEYDKNCKELDWVIQQLDDVISGKTVLDYEPAMPAGSDAKILEDKKFRDKQREEKKQYMDAVEKEPQKSTSQVIKDKVVGPEKVEPTSRVAKQLHDKKKAGMRRRMLINTDEDSDEEGNITTNPVAKKDTE